MHGKCLANYDRLFVYMNKLIRPVKKLPLFVSIFPSTGAECILYHHPGIYHTSHSHSCIVGCLLQCNLNTGLVIWGKHKWYQQQHPVESNGELS